ncbi:MAG: hypothetical protein M3O34_11040 [Chloroflexota bacterium]|nr:hypothetical protein [Chloroflexota bacterium]
MRQSVDVVLAVALILIGLSLSGCAGEPTTGAVRGLLTDVQAASLTMLREVELRAEDGRVLRFTVDGDTGITPGHAREHMVNAEPVTVTYRSEQGKLVALRIDD